MRSEGKGDMGFMEAMVAFMSVMIVLSVFLGVMANVTIEATDPVGTVDADRITGTVEAGVFIPGYPDYLGEFLDHTGCSGISVSVRIPGGFCEVPPPMTMGTMDGAVSSRTISSVVEDDNGRCFPAIFEVTVCR